MAINFRVIYQDREVMALFQRLQARFADTRPIMADFGEHMIGSIQKNFDAEGRPVKWAPLKLSSILGWFRKRKTRRTKTGAVSKAGSRALYGRKILTDTTRLRRSITYRAFPNRVELVTRVKYAIFHQEGTRKMVARPFLLVQREDWEYFINRWNRWLETA